MPIIEEVLQDKQQTVARIFEVSRTFFEDLDLARIHKGDNVIPLSSLKLTDFFNFVRDIPYQRDAKPVEIVARPRIIFERMASGEGKDCKKAAVLIGSYLEGKKVPWRLVTVSTRPDRQIHHIFVQADIFGDGQYYNLDATYSYMRPFESKKVTKAEIFS